MRTRWTSLIDKLVSSAGAVVAIALFALGGAAIYGGGFALDNVRDRLERRTSRSLRPRR